MEPGVTLFPFLSVLLSTMGVLAFLSISFLLITPELTEFQDRKQIEFQWVGAPGYVEPIFIRCFEDRIEYFDLFKNTNRSVELDSLIQQVKGGESELIRYLFSVLHSINASKNSSEKPNTIRCYWFIRRVSWHPKCCSKSSTRSNS